MHILIVNRFLGDERTPTARMVGDVVKHLADSGHTVTVLTTRGSYADGDGPHAHSSGTVRVRRLPTVGGRLTSWLAMWLQVCIRVPFMRWDRCVFLTDPPFMSVAAWLSRLVKPWRKCYWWTMDMYPEALVASGVIRRGGILSRLLSTMNNIGLRAVAGVICLGTRQRERLEGYANWRSVCGRCLVQPPWDERPLPRVPADADKIASELGAEGKHLVLYAGNIGRGHTFEDVLSAARLLHESEDERWRFAFVCRGARRLELEAAARDLPNVIVRDYFPADRTASLLWSARVHLITMADGWDGIIVPSKLYGALKTDAPVLFIGPSESDTAREIALRDAGELLANGCGGAAVVAALKRMVRTHLESTPLDVSGPERISGFVTA